MARLATWIKLTAPAPDVLCCNCRQPLAGDGFAQQTVYPDSAGELAGTPMGPPFNAAYVHGHPMCARACCYAQAWDERNGIRRVCGCGLRFGRRATAAENQAPDPAAEF